MENSDTVAIGDAYTYQQLRDPSKDIRLLQLRRKSQRVEYKLIVEPCGPTGSVPYEAISYRWDSPNRTQTVEVDGAQLSVTSAVYSILRELSPSSGTRYIWIDSVCINQEDRAEKERQIPLMTGIYSNAMRVIACLGNAPDAFLIPDFCAKLERYMRLQKQGGNVAPNIDRYNRSPFEEEAQNWNALQTLICHPFWSRAWIIQEIVVAKSTTLLYGNVEIAFETISDIAMAMKSLDDNGVIMLHMRNSYNRDWRSLLYGRDFISRLGFLRVVHHFSRLSWFQQQLKLWSFWISTFRTPSSLVTKMLSFPSLVVECAQSKATNPLDKVYALQGLDPQFQVEELRPNYNITPQELFKNVTLYALKSGSFSLFSLAGICHARETPHLPSWVPDLVSLPGVYPLDTAKTTYCAGGKAELLIDCSPTSTLLRLKGSLLDQIKVIDSHNPIGEHVTSMSDADINEHINGLLTGSGGQFFPALGSWLLQCTMLLFGYYEKLKKTTYFNRQELLEVLLRTLICDDDESQIPAAHQVIKNLEWFFDVMGLTERGSEEMERTIEAGKEPDFTIEQKLKFSQIFILLMRKGSGRQFALTELGFVCMVPLGAKEGDLVSIFRGCKVPYLLRQGQTAFELIDKPPGDERVYELVGETYVHGLMGSLYSQFAAETDAKSDWICLV